MPTDPPTSTYVDGRNREVSGVPSYLHLSKGREMSVAVNVLESWDQYVTEARGVYREIEERRRRVGLLCMQALAQFPDKRIEDFSIDAAVPLVDLRRWVKSSPTSSRRRTRIGMLRRR